VFEDIHGYDELDQKVGQNNNTERQELPEMISLRANRIASSQSSVSSVGSMLL
jgi:hypothetical protein